MDTDVGPKGEGTDHLALFPVEPEAEDDLAGLSLHLLLGVDDESKQAVGEAGVVAKDGFVKGVVAVLPLHRLVLRGEAPFAEALHKD